jgi:hypothetical protein
VGMTTLQKMVYMDYDALKLKHGIKSQVITKVGLFVVGDGSWLVDAVRVLSVVGWQLLLGEEDHLFLDPLFHTGVGSIHVKYGGFWWLICAHPHDADVLDVVKVDHVYTLPQWLIQCKGGLDDDHLGVGVEREDLNLNFCVEAGPAGDSHAHGDSLTHFLIWFFFVEWSSDNYLVNFNGNCLMSLGLVLGIPCHVDLGDDVGYLASVVHNVLPLRFYWWKIQNGGKVILIGCHFRGSNLCIIFIVMEIIVGFVQLSPPRTLMSTLSAIRSVGIMLIVLILGGSCLSSLH